MSAAGLMQVRGQSAGSAMPDEPLGRTSLLREASFVGAANIRWDAARAQCGDDVVPLSVADMDFMAPQQVVDAVVARAQQGAYGYTDVPEEHLARVANWLAERHGWRVGTETILPLGRVVEAVPALLGALTAPGDPVVVPAPSYSPVTSASAKNDRALVTVPMREEGGHYALDLPALEDALRAPTSTRPVLVLTSPHNPTGRVLTRTELEALAVVVERTDALVISDDVHADLVLPGHRHVPFASINDSAAAATLTFVSPGKTFNLAGLEIATLVVTNPDLRERAAHAFEKAGFHNPRYFAVEATRAAYEHGRPWLAELLELVAAHVADLREFLPAHVPGVRLIEPEGTYLAWLDLRGWSTDEAHVFDAMRREGLLLAPGSGFGADYAGFARVNLAVPTARFRDGLHRLARARARDVS